MSTRSRISTWVALCSAALLGVVSLTAAQAGQKKPSPAVAAGKAVFAANGCGACHKIQGKGGVTSTDLTKIGKKMKPAQLSSVIRKGAKGKTGVAMAAYGKDKINDKNLKNLVAYLASLK